MKINSGKLSHRLGIQELVYIEKNGSRIGSNWTTIYYCFGNVKRVTGSRVFELGKISQSKSYDITIRYKNDIPFNDLNEGELKSKYRLVEYNGENNIKHTFTIHTVDVDETNSLYNIVTFEKK